MDPGQRRMRTNANPDSQSLAVDTRALDMAFASQTHGFTQQDETQAYGLRRGAQLRALQIDLDDPGCASAKFCDK